MKNDVCDEKIDDCCITWRTRNHSHSMNCAQDVNTFHLICCCMRAELTRFPFRVLFSGSPHFYPLLALPYWQQYWLHVCYTPQTQGRGSRVCFECKCSPCGQCHSSCVHWTKTHSSPWNWKQIRNLCLYITMNSLSYWKCCSCAVKEKREEKQGQWVFLGQGIYAIKKLSPTLLCLLPFPSPLLYASSFLFSPVSCCVERKLTCARGHMWMC